MKKNHSVPILTLLFSAIVITPHLHAHGSVHDQIHKLSHDIEHHPDNAELWLKRGRLYMEDEHWQDAESDFEQALKVDPELRSALYFLARVQSRTGKEARALATVDRFLERLPADNRGGRFRAHSLRGEILMSMERFGDAADDFGHALAHADSPRPVHYLLHAEALIGAGQPEKALASLDAGLAELGSVAALENRALDLLRDLEKYEVVVERLRRLAASTPNPASPQIELGEALIRLERRVEAEEAFKTALQILDGLPPSRAGVPAMKALRQRAEAGLQAAQSSPTTPKS